eukprot:TRINITY_DN12459_c0_g1_i1.p1 TRINITY_DN12459_c0_g1~~TRINITY_DN12459_c0_g1_i1.p1  ORF type:complete len:927 (-),score=276.78 TRINITY_DN12459_c0_g1_i1:70-2850(-)
MSPKQQISTPAAGEPPEKKLKTDAKKEPEEELEKDAKSVSGRKLGEAVAMNMHDSTLNLVPTSQGKVLMALSDYGLQFLVAGSRANVGIKAGRYLFEIRVLEVLMPGMPGGKTQPHSPIPRQQCRVGFSTQKSAIYLGETKDSVCFDADGCFISNGKKSSPNVAERFVRDNVLGVLLNLDSTSPNCNTVSLFKDGRRASKPMPLPEHLHGQALFPHVAFRNVTLQVNFGPGLMSSLPFKCRTLQEALASDVTIAAPPPTVDGKYEVLFPVALPDEGTFDWLDGFLEKNPDYVELSDRKIVEWAVNSGLGKPRMTSLKNCNDKPDVSFGIQVIDELTPRKLLQSVSALMPRNYIVMEVKQNLTKADRKQLLEKFSFPHYKRVAAIVVGEPPEEFKAKVRARMLEDKQEKVNAEWKQKQAERERKKLVEVRQKQLLDQRKAYEEAKKKEQEAALKAKKEAEEKAKAEAEAEAGDEAKAEGEDDVKKEEVKEETTEETKEEAKDEEKAKEEEQPDVEMKEEEPEETEPPKAELTEEELKTWFLTRPITDMVSTSFNSAFVDFSLPDADEDFAEIRYEWGSEATCKEYMQSWMKAKKTNTRVEDLAPSEWFMEQLTSWQRITQDWQLKQKEFKQDPVRMQSAAARAQKEKLYREKMQKEARNKEEASKEDAPKEEASKEETAKEEAPKEEAGEEKKDEEQKDEEMKEEEKDADGQELENFTPVDIYTIDDVCDCGEGEPMFSSFTFEDWSLMNLRFEILLLIRAFKQDVTDPDRPGVHEQHLPYYYNRYFRKPLNVKFFGVESCLQLADMIKDVISIKDGSILEQELSEAKLSNIDILVRISEESRRERQRRIDAGDETAVLKFSMAAQQQVHTGQNQSWGKAAGAATPKSGGFGGGWGQGSRPNWGKGGFPNSFRPNLRNWAQAFGGRW